MEGRDGRLQNEDQRLPGQTIATELCGTGRFDKRHDGKVVKGLQQHALVGLALDAGNGDLESVRSHRVMMVGVMALAVGL